MMMRFTIPGICACLLALGLSSAGADEPNPSPLKPPAEAVSIQAWGERNPGCAEWTNACAVCKRDDSGKAGCSTPGIACQPKAISCSQNVEKSLGTKP